ncbi:MAG: DUF2079 domain-containing protein [Xenococcaceae cyanobacterium MO_167.B52]|nr:DUF2079 domain-containing protein [Xenococcaceae cyanobacterium MO_167.B52]
MSLILLIGISASILFICSSIRHLLFQSNFDLAIFDNALYLISQGQQPFVAFRGLHILGDHAALILYPLAGLYKIYPSIYWLFAIQAVALALGTLPLWYLAREAGLKQTETKTVILVYLLYPLIFNVNLADFHPEVMAIPAILGAVLAARKKQLWWFILAIAFILSCKAVLALTVVGMGVWLIGWERKYQYGAIAISSGLVWFALATQIIIPHFSGSEAAAVDRYSYLGNSVLEIIQNLLLKPWLIGNQVFSLGTLEYIILLILPVLWAISFRSNYTPLIGAIPILLVNILSESASQRNLVHQYSLPILPWLFLVVISTMAARKAWLKSQRAILLWSICAFLALAKFGYFGSLYLESLDTWRATSEAIAQIQTKDGVLTNTDIAPHLTHRPLVQLATIGSESNDLSEIKYVLLNFRHPGWASSRETVEILGQKLRQMPEFKLQYQRDDVVLWVKIRDN